MNRLVLIGNGFDLAHGLKTSYADFIRWYYDKRVLKMSKTYESVSNDCLCSFKYLDEGTFARGFQGHPALWKDRDYGIEIFEDIIQNSQNYESKLSPFFQRIRTTIETKGWVDIENEYYKLLTEYAFPVTYNPLENGNITQLNEQLRYLQDLLIQYLQEVEQQQEVSMIKCIKDAIFAPFEEKDIAITEKKHLQEHVDSWVQPTEDVFLKSKLESYGVDVNDYISELESWRNQHTKIYPHTPFSICPKVFFLPNDIMFLDFNYTHIANKYVKDNSSNIINHIHGEINKPDGIIFGYGDELDSNYKRLQELNKNEYLQNVKSIRYLEAPNYRDTLSFIESAPFQVLIMGHSCGNSDRTLLNTIFEHKNCVSIKLYYYEKEDGTDNYRELVQNISRNFTNMKLMRDRVVNKTQCKPLVQD